MKKILLLCLAAVVLASCNDRIHPSGNVISVDQEIGQFSKIRVSSGLNATITMAEEVSLKVTADDNILPYIETFVSDDELVVKIKKGTSFKGNPTLRVAVGATELESCSGTGGSVLKFTNNLAAPQLKIDLSGGSHYAGSITADGLAADLSGGSTMIVGGTCETLTLGCSGGSVFGQGFEFTSDAVDANLSGGSHAKLTVNKSLKVNASGGSVFLYKGEPATVDRNASGGSTISPAN